MEKIYDIAITGAGPAGISSAVEAAMVGIGNICIFEKAENHSATIRKYYKDNKRVDKNWKGREVDIEGRIVFMDGTKESTLNYFDALLTHHKIEAFFSTEIYEIKKENELFTITASGDKMVTSKNVIIAIGNMGKPNKPSYPIPASLKERVQHTIDCVCENEDIVVVGGGDSATEFAYFLADKSRVTLSYRRDEITRASEVNLAILNQYVNDGKIKLKLGVDIESMEDEGGRPRLNFADGESKVCDRVIYALGGTMPVDFLKRCGIELDETGRPCVNDFHETGTPGLYIAGDIIARTGGSIAMGLNHAHKIVNHVRRRMGNMTDEWTQGGMY